MTRTVAAVVELGKERLGSDRKAPRIGNDHVVENHFKNVHMEPPIASERFEHVLDILAEGNEELEVEELGQVPEIVVEAELMVFFVVEILLV